MDLEELKGEIQRLCLEIAGQGDSLDARRLTSLAEQQGWVEVRQRGAHHQFRHPVRRPDGGRYAFTLAYHGNNGTFDRGVVRNTVQAIFQPQIDQLLQQNTPDGAVETIDRLLEAISPENISTSLFEKYKEAEQRIKAFETKRLEEAELAGQELRQQELARIQTLQSQLNQVAAQREDLAQAKQRLEDELCVEREHGKMAYQQLQKLEKQILDKDAEIAALKTQQADLQKALEQSQVDLATQHTQAHTLEKKLRTQIEAAQREALDHTSGLRQELEAAQSQQMQLQGQRAQLEQQLQERESEFERLEDDRQTEHIKAGHTIEHLEAELVEARQRLAVAVNRKSVHDWLQTLRTQVQGGRFRRWFIQIAVAVAVVCISWVSQLL